MSVTYPNPGEVLPYVGNGLRLDEITALQPGQSATSEWTPGVELTDGHFPDGRIVPGIRTANAGFQAAAYTALTGTQETSRSLIPRLDSVRSLWMKPVLPGDTLSMDVELTKLDSRRFVAQVIGTLASSYVQAYEGKYEFNLADIEDLRDEDANRRLTADDLVPSDIGKVTASIPHRFPMRFVDGIEDPQVQEDGSRTTRLSWKPTSEHYTHLSDFPFLGLEELAESMAQGASWVAAQDEDPQNPRTPLFTSMRVGDKGLVLPGEWVTSSVSVRKTGRRGVMATGESSVGGMQVARANLEFVLVSQDTLKRILTRS